MRRIERDQRRVAVAPIGDLFEQRTVGRLVRLHTSRSGTAPRASARLAPIRMPRRSAMLSIATTRNAFLIFATTASGAASGGAPERRPVPLRADQPVGGEARQKEAEDPHRALPLPSFGKASLMSIPLHREGARRPAAVLLQREPPGHAADPGGETADLAAGAAESRKRSSAALGSASPPRRRRKPVTPACAGAKRAAAGGGQIERGLPELADRDAETLAARAPPRRPRAHPFSVLAATATIAGGVEAQGSKAGRVKLDRSRVAHRLR